MTKHARRLAALVVAAALGAVVLTGCAATTNGNASAVPSGSLSTAASTPTNPSTTAVSSAPTGARPVHVALLPGDGATVGVGMPIIASFNVKITDARAFAAATTVTADGVSVAGSWYFETSDPASGHVMEAHYRPQHFWPAHAHIHMGLPVYGLSAGTGLAFDDNLTIDFDTGAAHIGLVDDAAHTLTISNDGKPWGTFPVSLGASDPTMRTFSGWKVIMEKLRTVCMRNVENTYHDCGIMWDQRLTYSGEYLHSAPWNCAASRSPGCTGPYNNIGNGDSSNGCTNLMPADAVKLYNFLQVGDPINYPNANGGKMQLGQGYGDWNVPWKLWQTAGIVPTR